MKIKSLLIVPTALIGLLTGVNASADQATKDKSDENQKNDLVTDQIDKQITGEDQPKIEEKATDATNDSLSSIDVGGDADDQVPDLPQIDINPPSSGSSGSEIQPDRPSDEDSLISSTPEVDSSIKPESSFQPKFSSSDPDVDLNSEPAQSKQAAEVLPETGEADQGMLSILGMSLLASGLFYLPIRRK